jgi:3-hydroxyacyl-CoA dehydrogenase/enoyl-CoA hydratase/3-hydroxybutyryl-CoA epimerase
MSFFQAQTLRVDQQSNGTMTIWLDVPGRSINVITRQVLADFDAALDRVNVATILRALVIRSAKASGFLAGADLHEFTQVKNPADAVALSAVGQTLFDKVASLRVPVIAVIHGPCLGGGLELALACDYRLAVDSPGTQLGLPEIELGLLPAWGGTQRLPRVVGLERAFNVILLTRRLGPRDALRWGLADIVAADERHVTAELERLAETALTNGKRPKTSLPRRTWRQTLLEFNPFGRGLLFRATERRMRRRVADDMPAPREALEAMRVGVTQGMDAGLAYERDAVGHLAMTPACRNLIGLFFQREEARKLPAQWKEAAPVRRVGVVGVGTMGAGIAQLAAVRGLEVVIQEVNEEALGTGLLKIAALFEKAVERGILTKDEADRKLSTLRGGTTWQGFDTVDLVIEAAIEDLDAKRALFRELDRRTRPTAVLATNTSSLMVASLLEGLSHPERVAGMHFFNPVHKMPLVEVACTPQTDEKAVALLARLAVALGKTPVVVKDSPGFVVNRILMPYLNEAVSLVGEGLSIAQVDAVMTRFGMLMGPLEVLDQVGLDVAAHVARAMQPAFGDRFPPNPAFEMMRQKNWLGQKNGVGFYRHRGKKIQANELAQNSLRAAYSGDARLSASLPLAVRLQQARERMVVLMINEAARCHAEGLAASASAIDLAMVLGSGWAPHRGGPLRYADDRGSGEVVKVLADLAQRFGPRFEPSADLRRVAESGASFTSQAAATQAV